MFVLGNSTVVSRLGAKMKAKLENNSMITFGNGLLKALIAKPVNLSTSSLKMSNAGYVILVGNPLQGIKEILGPFFDEDEAIEWAADNLKDPYWWTKDLKEPDWDILDGEIIEESESGLVP